MRTFVIVLVCFFCSLFSSYAQPSSDFIISGTSPACVDQEVDFVSLAFGGVVQWDWDFGDGSTSTAVNPSHTYTDVGTFTVTLVVTDGDGLTDSSMQNYIVRPPKADFVVNPAIGCTTPHTVFFTDQSTFPDTWSWNFGDGNTSTLQNPVHNYTAYGDFMASLTVSDTIFGCTDTIIIPIKVAGVTPDFTANGSTFGGFGCGPLEVDFEDTSIVSGNDTIATWFWDFGDGNTSITQNPTHIYPDSGIYEVSLTTTLATTGCSNTETKPAFVQVIGPGVDFSTADPTSGCPPLTVNFMDMTTFTSPIVAWDWDFGDGNTSNLINPTNIYTTEGLFDVSLTITDIDGCSRTETKMGYIDTRDTTPPIITCSSDQTELVDGNCEFVLPDYTGLATASDNCGSVTVSQSPIPGTIVASGTTTITLTASDGTNTNSCTFNVIVEDAIAPQASCVAPFTVQLDATGMTSIDVNDIDNGSTDNCGIASSFLDVTSFDCTNIGVNTITLTVVDNAGNLDFCTVDVTVEDIETPTAICQDITIQLDAAGNANISANAIDGGSTDNCSIASFSVDIDTFDCSNVGLNNVMLTVTDASGNSDSCMAVVTVEDNVLPTAVCQDITIQLDASGSAMIVAANVDAGSADACGIATTSIDISSFNCSNIGANNVTLLVTDTHGNTSSCIAVVTVEDAIAPQASCVSSFIVQLDATGMASIDVNDIDNGSTDNCGIASSFLDITSFDCTHIGVNTVTLTVVDESGNSDFCTVQVTVEDSINPTAVCQDITIQLDATGNASIIPSDVDGGSSDNCGINSSMIDIAAFDCTSIGTNNVVLTVSDASGNSDSCTAIVTVEDNVAPTVNCQDITISLDASGNVTIVPADINLGTFDACGIASTSIDIDTFNCSNIGPNNVTLFVTDVNGNTGSCVAVITVEDNDPPVAVCQDITIQLELNGVATILPSDVDGGSTDNCDTPSLTIDIDTFDCSNVGPNNVVFTVTDAGGNITSCVAVVTVEDNVAPSAVCQDITIQLDASGTATINANDVDGGSTDACGINAFSIDIDTFDCSNLGANNVILTVVDANGNSATCIAVVTVEEQNAIPMAVCQNITVPLQADGTATIDASDVNAGSSGMGCFNGLTIDINTFDCSDVGTPVAVTLMVTNGNGDTDTCTAMVNVVDSLSPTIQCANDISVTENIPYTLPDYFDTGVVTAIDNCENQLVSTQVPVPGTQLQPGTYNITVSIADPSGNSDTCVVRLTVNDILNVEENTRLSSVVLFPNPASSFINISNPKGVSLQQISIVDMAGRIVKHMILDAGASSQKISVSQLASATYMVIITSEKGQLVQQLVKE